MYLLPRFNYYSPKDTAEACRLLAEMKGDAKVLAGGTDLLVNMKKGTVKSPNVVNVLGLKELEGIEKKNGTISIGSAVTAAELAESQVIRDNLSALAKGARWLGSPLIRNRATVGGNVVTARPAADTPPPLLIYGAKAVLQSARGEREVPLDDFFVGPGQTVITPDEVLTRILLEKPPAFTGADYIKLGHRNSLEIAIVAVASRFTLDKKDGVISDVRIVLSAVAPKAIRAPLAEKMLMGQKPSEELFAKAASVALTECTPIDDIRGGADYRCSMVEVLTKRTLMAAWNEARGGRS